MYPASPCPLPPDELASLQALIKRYCGLRLDGYKLEYHLQRAWPTLFASGVQDVPGLIQELGFMGGRTWVKLLPFLTINETYFLREAGQLQDFMALALPALAARAEARGDRHLRLLSAACSTGEEAYTLAMLLTDAGVACRVLGVDIDREAIARAEEAVYGRNSFRGEPPGWRDAHFEPVGEEAWWVNARYRERTAFRRLNLLQAEADLGTQRFDAIACRNVLIYFDRPTQLEVIRQLRQLLVPGGYLLLGHSEMFFEVDLGLKVHTTPRATMYQREATP